MTHTDARPDGTVGHGPPTPAPRSPDPLSTLDAARSACAGLRALGERADVLRTQVASSLAAIDHHRRSGAVLTFDEVQELETARDQLLDLLGDVHQTCDPYAVWADVETSTVATVDSGPGVVTIELGESPAESHFGIVANAADAMVGVDANKRITAWNDACERLLGWSRDDVLGQPLSLIIPENESEEFQRRFGLVLDGRPETADGVRRHRDGSLVELKITPSAIFTAQGEVVGALATYRPVRRRSDRD